MKILGFDFFPQDFYVEMAFKTLWIIFFDVLCIQFILIR